MRIQQLSIQEMFVLCQQHGFDVDLTTERLPAVHDKEVAFVVELEVAA